MTYPPTYLKKLPSEGKKIKLRKELEIEIETGEDTAFRVFSPSVQVGGTGTSIEGAITDMANTMVSLWETYSSCSRSELDTSAITLLNMLDMYLKNGR